MEATERKPKFCAWCFREFVPKRRTQRFCIADHQRAYWQDAYKRAALAHREVA